MAETKEGGTNRDHLEAVARMTGERPAELEVKPCPEVFVHAWGWFLELNRARTSNGFGINPISFCEIVAWASLTGRNPSALDILAIREIDTAYVTRTADKLKAQT